jgi:hypothetical protein
MSDATETGTPETSTLYKVRRPKGWLDPMTVGELWESLFAVKSVPRPDDTHTPEVECYCLNEECVVREVFVRMKRFGEPEPQPPQYRCPICGGEMEKHGYREYITLSPVEDREPANGPPPTNVKT